MGTPLRAILGSLLVGLVGCSREPTADVDSCAPDLTKLVRVETLARESGPMGITARSVLSFLGQERPTSGFLISRAPISDEYEKLQYQLYHDSGFSKPCSIRNRSGIDGVLNVNPSTHEAEGFERW